MSELRLAQEALIKVIQRKEVDIFAADEDELESELMKGDSPYQLSDNDPGNYNKGRNPGEGKLQEDENTD